MALFICGTDTGIGKTHVAAAIMRRFHREVEKLRYWKPVQTGACEDDDRAMACKLSNLEDDFFLPTGATFRSPLSPHLAAELENEKIELESVISDFNRYSAEYEVVVEGAGGLLVPINRTVTWLDFIKAVKIRVLLVARSGLGTINHSLLTLERFAQSGVTVCGVIYCGDLNEDNMRTIEEFSGAPTLGVMQSDERGVVRLDGVFCSEAGATFFPEQIKE